MKFKVAPRVIECNLTPSEWELYYYDGIEEETARRSERAAKDLNATFKTAVNEGLSPTEVARRMDKVMVRYSKAGASDSEPYYVLRYLLEKTFGEHAKNVI